MTANRDRLPRWDALIAALERLLYEHDPDGMGASVSAPLDEYHDVAVAVVRALRDRNETQPIEASLLEIVPSAGSDLIRDIREVWSDFSSTSDEA